MIREFVKLNVAYQVKCDTKSCPIRVICYDKSGISLMFKSRSLSRDISTVVNAVLRPIGQFHSVFTTIRYVGTEPY